MSKRWQKRGSHRCLYPQKNDPKRISDLFICWCRSRNLLTGSIDAISCRHLHRAFHIFPKNCLRFTLRSQHRSLTATTTSLHPDPATNAGPLTGKCKTGIMRECALRAMTDKCGRQGCAQSLVFDLLHCVLVFAKTKDPLIYIIILLLLYTMFQGPLSERVVRWWCTPTNVFYNIHIV